MPSVDNTLPLSVRVCHRTFKLSYDKKDRMQDNGEEAKGLSSWDDGWIAVDPNLPSEVLAEIVLHETMHQHWEFMGLGKSANEERAVTAMARAMCAIMKQNPELMEWLKRNLDGQ